MKPDDTRDACPNCGTAGHRCYGNDDQGPDHEDWIGESGEKPCCHACYQEQST